MPVSHEKKIIFVHVPRTGGSTLDYLFSHKNWDYWGGDPNSDKHPDHFSALQIKECIGDKRFNSYFKYAFVRNPYDRFVSNFRISHGLLPNHERVNDFKLFCNRIYDIVKSKRDIMYQTSTEMLYINGELAMDYVGRYENYVNDVKTICNKLNQDITNIPKENASGSYITSQYYDQECYDIVYDLYADDFKNFNYFRKR